MAGHGYAGRNDVHMRNPLDSRYIDLVKLLRRYGRSDLVSGAQLDEFADHGREHIRRDRGG